MPEKKPNQKTKQTENKEEVRMELADSPEFRRDPTFISAYVNSTQFGFTRWDFQMVFGKVEISRDKSVGNSREVVSLTMTPQYAKALLIDFAKVMHSYESTHGEIQLPPDLTKG